MEGESIVSKPRLLFVWSAADFSTWDLSRGYRNALIRRDTFEVFDYKLSQRMKYHAAALGEDRAANLDLLSRMASENIVVEALKRKVSFVFIISGMALHPDAIWYLRQVGIPAVTLFTESPYQDEEQRAFHAVYPEMRCLTTERTSAGKGWSYVAHAYDPLIHHPVDDTKAPSCDVLLIGTFWPERIALLEQVDWTGIDLRLAGTWIAPPTPDESPIGRYFEDGCIHNVEAVKHYAAAKICLNPHRAHPQAESLNPRAYELAACHAFQLTDQRAEVMDVFGHNGTSSVATYATAEQLEHQIRHWLPRDEERAEWARQASERVAPCTFDERLTTLLSQL